MPLSCHLRHFVKRFEQDARGAGVLQCVVGVVRHGGGASMGFLLLGVGGGITDVVVCGVCGCACALAM